MAQAKAIYTNVGVTLKPDNSNSHEFELHRPSNKGTKLLLNVIKAIIIITVIRPRGLAVPRGGTAGLAGFLSNLAM